jgi:hypothetical protein
MIANINNRGEVESFLRFADKQQLQMEKGNIEKLLEAMSPPVSESLLKSIAGRIAYELRFRTH